MTAPANSFFRGGLGPLPLGSPAAAGYVAFAFENFQTPVIDLTQPASGIELVPARPGHVAVAFGASLWVIESAAGVQVAPATVRAGSDPARTNSIPLSSSTPASSDVAAAIATLPLVAIGPPSAPAGVAKVVGAPVLLDVVTGAQGTGGFSLRASLCTRVIWAAI